MIERKTFFFFKGLYKSNFPHGRLNYSHLNGSKIQKKARKTTQRRRTEKGREGEREREKRAKQTEKRKRKHF